MRRSPFPAALPGSRRAARHLALHGLGLIPIAVYQMAKVGSSAVVDSLLRSRLATFHIHRMNPIHIASLQDERRKLGWRTSRPMLHDRLGAQLLERVIARRAPARVVTLVRDPIARNLSSYFEHLDDIWSTDRAHESIPLDALCAGFFERYTHREPLTWFDDELLPVLGIDVYAHPFPRTGHMTARAGSYDVLVLKSEVPDAVKHAALESYLGIDLAPIVPANRTERTPKGAAYEEFKRHIRLTPAYVEEMLSARYTRHFYDEVEREAMRKRYLDRA